MNRMLVFAGTVIALSVELAGARLPSEVNSDGALAQVRIKVVDQDGGVVVGAKIWGGFTSGKRIDDYNLVDGVTDTKGEFMAQGWCNDFLRFDVTKEGFYHAEEKIIFGRSSAHSKVVDGKWHPYGETRTVTLKRIKKPGKCIPFARSLRDVAIPKFGVWMGFDLEKGSWVSPLGKGRQVDMLLKFTSYEVNVYRDFRYVMEVSFTNNACAGAYLEKIDSSSDLKTAYLADTNGVFQANYGFYAESVPNKGRSSYVLDDSSYLVYRTRTKVDENGRLVSAHYGMIKGAWLFDSKGITFSDGCFNPVENDTNIEDGRYLRQLDVLRAIR